MGENGFVSDVGASKTAPAENWRRRGELEKGGVDGHSRVVSVMWVHYAKGSSELGTGSERHRE